MKRRNTCPHRLDSDASACDHCCMFGTIHPDEFGGSDEGSHYMSQERIAATPQPPPATSTAPAVWDLVMQDMKDRDGFGVSKYGVRLRPHDGRDSLVDAYQEALDLVVYLRKAIYEREAR